MLGSPATSLAAWVAPISDLMARCNLSGLRRRRVCEVSLVLLHLLQDLQLHRGLSGAVLLRDGRFRMELEAVEYTLQRSLHALADQFGERHRVFREAQWRIVLGRWESLRNHWRDLNFATNLAVHGEVIVGILGILRRLASDNARLLGEERSQVLRLCPALAEHFGILRALGLHLLCGPGAGQDQTVQYALRSEMRTAAFKLQAVAPSIHEQGLVAAGEAALQSVARILDGTLGAADAEWFYEDMTGVMDAWYRMIRGRIQMPATEHRYSRHATPSTTSNTRQTL
jgi:hypothetical protein